MKFFALAALCATSTSAIKLEGDYFKPGFSGMIGASAYERVTTPHFSGDDDDIFMRSMIENYALE